MATTHPHRLDFWSVDPEQNRARFYRVFECTTLFGERTLRVEWGRLGADVIGSRVEPMSDDNAVACRIAELARQRQSHGYQLAYSA